MIVVDTNIVAYFVFPSAQTPDVEVVRAKDHEWSAPSLLRYELLNIAAQYVRRDLLDRDRAEKAFRRGLSLVRIIPEYADSVEVLNLSQRTGCSPYDIEFACLAERLGVPLITCDQQLLAPFLGSPLARPTLLNAIGSN